MLIARQLQTLQTSLAQHLKLHAREARIEAQSLMRGILGNVSRAWLIMHENDTLTVEQHLHLERMLQRRLAGEPMAYILGTREFYGLEFKVTTDVLIPRPDTETLVDAALARISEHQPCRVLDLGTGSGAIAIAIAHHRPKAQVVAIDASAAAIAIAIDNARRLNISNIHWLLSDWFNALGGEKFDVIVSNPPYIAEHDAHLEDLQFEPKTALTSGSDGLDDIRSIVSQAPQHLNPDGWLLLEHGYDQASATNKLLENQGFFEIALLTDLAGLPRITFGKMQPK